ncbi:UNVERIFIED_CONTAM: hypothetical protein KB579_03260 [Streptococcus canis]|uniref:hypothetical protein n=1 Tax=Streptococcus canis TaxID=1329 RepID=UPI0012F21C73|nr:hypothetical protein [Streptococcus canis]QKG74516.1 hypothetical protein GE023_009670 [Streptococcus canis]QKG75373.1 hypothetical protein GE022_003560 [Streptococcus canis]GFE45362.1 hypothetical protein ScFU6_11310 [Streptococcus canis]
MIDEAKVKRLKLLAIGLVAVVILLIVFGIGQMTARPKHHQVDSPKMAQRTSTVKKLSYAQVKAFLIAYYTKKDLGTNRNRYKPFMTKALYQEETSKEDEPVNQAYKGYVVDFMFKEADIYINPKTNVAIAQVTYTDTLLEKKGKYDKAQKNVSNQATLKLSYVEEKGRLKLNTIQPALLQLNSEAATNLPDYGTMNNTSKETSSQKETTQGDSN